MRRLALAALLLSLALAGCLHASEDDQEENASLDEERIAFVGDPDSDDATVVAISPDGTDREQLTRLGPLVQPWPESPSFSPDGRHVAYVGVHRRGEPEATTRELYVVEADGSHEGRETRNTTEELDVDWFPDGRIVFVSCQTTHWRDELPECDLVAMGPDGDDREELSKIPLTYDFAVSPDGRRIAYSQLEGQSHSQHLELYVADIDGSNRRRLTENDSGDALPAWSPDGKRIAFVSNRAESAPCFYYDCAGFTNELYVMDADGSDVTRLTETDEEELSPSWSPDGEEIVYVRVADDDGPHYLYVANADGSCARRLVEGQAPDWHGPSSDDGLECCSWLREAHALVHRLQRRC
jgi:TolB protein